MTTTPPSIPFTKIIITFPTKSAADTSEPYLHTILSYKNVEIIITSDPHNVKLGSGGGTLSALSLVLNNVIDDIILIIHAGGDSSRCPNQMIIGKAWSCVPKVKDGIVENPIVLLINSLSELLDGVIIKGSVIVAASDCILHLPRNTFDNVNDNVDVLGVAVPSPYHTAKNHGVYVCNGTKDQDKLTNSIQGIKEILQKPSIETLNTILGKEGEGDEAWIDTGIILFYPKAVQKLKYLLTHTSYSNYTHDGIYALLQSNANLERIVPKIDIYTHVLHAIDSISHENMISYNSMYPNIDKCLYKHLNDLSLKVFTIPNGSFIHLGTTKEYRDYILDINFTLGENKEQNVTRAISKYDNLNHHCYTYLPHSIVKFKPFNNVIYNTLVDSLEDDHTKEKQTYNDEDKVPTISIDNNTILEHCHIIVQKANDNKYSDTSTNILEIHSNSLVSGVNCIIPQQTSNKNIIASNMLLHQIQLSSLLDQENEYVWMYLGINDKIKSLDTIYNIPVQTFLQDIGLTLQDLFDEEEHILWNAKLHVIEKYNVKVIDDMMLPILHSNNDTLFPFQWISDYVLHKTIPPSSIIQQWKCSKRISLKEIIAYSRNNLATVQLKYIFTLQSTIQQKQKCYIDTTDNTLMQRKHKPVELINFLGWDVINKTLYHHLDNDSGEYDIISRCFMILSKWCLDTMSLLVNATRNDDTSDTTSALEQLFCKNYDMPNSTSFKKYCYFLLSQQPYNTRHGINHLQCLIDHYEEVSYHLTRACIGFNTFRFDKAVFSIDTRMKDQWVVVTAPARIDISGGWSDTPPISYEYGGSVANLAVTIDGKHPFLVKCRLKTGNGGLLLVTQDLVCKKEVHVHTVWDLIKDYRNPLHGEAVLIKAALICLGLVPLEYLTQKNAAFHDQSINPFLKTFLGIEEETSPSIEIVSISNLPQGSGMGGSSILGGCILAAIGTLKGLDMSTSKDHQHNLIHAVLALEQIMTTGGGWQDQIGGLIGGFKLTKSSCNQITPLSLSIQVVTPQHSQHDIYTQLSKRLVLVYTGKSRLAKNILQNVLRRWNTRSCDIMSTVQSLVDGAEDAKVAFQDNDIAALGKCLHNYWEQKKVMAGCGSNVEPAAVGKALKILYELDEIIGGSLCGAGGGGFLVLLARDGRVGMELKHVLEDYIKSKTSSLGDNDVDDCILNDFTWHTCEPVEHGLVIDFVDDMDLEN